MLKLYSIYDAAHEEFHLPFEAPNDAVACRSFVAAINTPGPLNIAAEDVSLMKIGEFDPKLGCHSDYNAPERILDGRQAIAANRPHFLLQQGQEITDTTNTETN